MIRAIPTKYRGITYRSRLEATWAYFFDEIGFNYHYELEGFQLNNIRYLPDFYIPERDTWIEIKPKKPTKEEWTKAALLLLELVKTGSNANVAILYGRPWVDDIGPEYIYLNLYAMLGEHDDENGNSFEVTTQNITLDHIDDDQQIFVQCRRCKSIGLDSVAMHYPDKFGGYAGLHGCCDSPGATIPNGDTLLKAYAKDSDKKF